MSLIVLVADFYTNSIVTFYPELFRFEIKIQREDDVTYTIDN